MILNQKKEVNNEEPFRVLLKDINHLCSAIAEPTITNMLRV